jgi:hypothetical protein
MTSNCLSKNDGNLFSLQEYVVQVERLLGPSHDHRRQQQRSIKSNEKEDPGLIRPTAWTLQRRYTDFRNLHLSLQNNVAGLDIQFPGKKMTGNLGLFV